MKTIDQVMDSYAASNNKENFIKNFIYNKKFRDCSLIDQKTFLKYIFESIRVPLPVMMNARIAYAHKSMETLSFKDSVEAINILEDNLNNVQLLENTNSIRTDSNHILFSTLSVLFHLAFFSKKFELLSRYSEIAIDGFEEIDEVTVAFYQTCTNVARVLSFSFIHYYLAGDEKNSRKCFSHIKNSFRLGVVNSDDHPVKFLELLEATDIYHNAKKLVSTGPVFSDLESLFLSSIRTHEQRKVDILMENFRSLAG